MGRGLLSRVALGLEGVEGIVCVMMGVGVVVVAMQGFEPTREPSPPERQQDEHSKARRTEVLKRRWGG